MMPVLHVDAPLVHAQEWVACAISAAAKYRVPANVVLAIAEKEGGKPGQRKANRNGSHDVGPMQFNTSYISDLARYGITANDVAVTGCYAFDLAAWRLRRHITTDAGDLWTKAANYHSRTPQYNQAYRTDLIRKAAVWATWLDARFVTHGLAEPGAMLAMQDHAQKAKQIIRQHEDPHTDIVAKTSHLYKPIPSYVPRMLMLNKQ